MTQPRQSTQSAKLDKLLEQTNTIAENVVGSIEKLNKTVYGNGNEKEGLVVRVNNLEIALNKFLSTMDWLGKLVVGSIILGILGGIGYLILSAGPQVLH